MLFDESALRSSLSGRKLQTMNHSVCFSADSESDPLAAASKDNHVGRAASNEELCYALWMAVGANIVIASIVAVRCAYTAFILWDT